MAIEVVLPRLNSYEMIEIILETLRKNNLKDVYIRSIISRGIGDLGLDPRKCEEPSVIVIAQGWGLLYGNSMKQESQESASVSGEMHLMLYPRISNL
jgi:branched-subunit amino acid aminotransferase/4-amino-4-deoxychorismate lyase